MGVRSICFGVALIGLSLNTTGAMAAEKGGLMHRLSCTAVRYYVALYSPPAGEPFARGQGATDADIEAARRCIRPSDLTHTASAQK